MLRTVSGLQLVQAMSAVAPMRELSGRDWAQKLAALEALPTLPIRKPRPAVPTLPRLQVETSPQGAYVCQPTHMRNGPQPRRVMFRSLRDRD
jgi:hypothetical protein